MSAATKEILFKGLLAGCGYLALTDQGIDAFWWFIFLGFSGLALLDLLIIGLRKWVGD